jgi:hypothetical protein
MTNDAWLSPYEERPLRCVRFNLHTEFQTLIPDKSMLNNNLDEIRGLSQGGESANICATMLGTDLEDRF